MSESDAVFPRGVSIHNDYIYTVQIPRSSPLEILFPKYKTAERKGIVWYQCRKCKDHQFVKSTRWKEHNRRKDHQIQDSDGKV